MSAPLKKVKLSIVIFYRQNNSQIFRPIRTSVQPATFDNIMGTQTGADSNQQKCANNLSVGLKFDVSRTVAPSHIHAESNQTF